MFDNNFVIARVGRTPKGNIDLGTILLTSRKMKVDGLGFVHSNAATGEVLRLHEKVGEQFSEEDFEELESYLGRTSLGERFDLVSPTA